MFPKKTYKKRLPTKAQRGKFSQKTIAAIIERDNGMCAVCGSEGQEIHHSCFKSQGGRGVFTNGILLCRDCHTRAHREFEFAQSLRDEAEERYGSRYSKDEYDE